MRPYGPPTPAHERRIWTPRLTICGCTTSSCAAPWPARCTSPAPSRCSPKCFPVLCHAACVHLIAQVLHQAVAVPCCLMVIIIDIAPCPARCTSPAPCRCSSLLPHLVNVNILACTSHVRLRAQDGDSVPSALVRRARWHNDQQDAKYSHQAGAAPCC